MLACIVKFRHQPLARLAASDVPPRLNIQSFQTPLAGRPPNSESMVAVPCGGAESKTAGAGRGYVSAWHEGLQTFELGLYVPLPMVELVSSALEAASSKVRLTGPGVFPPASEKNSYAVPLGACRIAASSLSPPVAKILLIDKVSFWMMPVRVVSPGPAIPAFVPKMISLG